MMHLLITLSRKSSSHQGRDQCTCYGLSEITTGIFWRGIDSTITIALTHCLVLGLLSHVYNPISLVAPFTVGALLILRDIWRVSGWSWDDQLPEDTVDRFLAWCVDDPQLAQFTIPRSFFSGTFIHRDVRMFGDNSHDVIKNGFRRARVTCTTRRIKTELAFVLGKARVALMKVMTIPKLELQAALFPACLEGEI